MSRKIRRLDAAAPDFRRRLQRLSGAGGDPQVSATVADILAAVRDRGDAAVCELTERFDGFRPTPATLRVPAAELRAAARALDPAMRAAIGEAIACVRAFHQRGLPRSWSARNPHGARVGERWYPLQRVGIYIPGGNAPLVSTAVMTIPLAKLARVPEIAVFTPAGRDGRVSPQMLAGLWLCGAREVYRVGGAQAIAAMAYGTRTIPPVCKIMGPGNAYVAEAQRQVFGAAGIDLLPGPSEEAVIADASARPDWIAADLLAQAEHGSGRERVWFIYFDEAQADAVEAAIAAQLPALRNAAAIRRVLRAGTLFIRVADAAAAAAVANLLAPEHLELHTAPALRRRLLRAIHTAGAILCGHTTPTVLGDFTAGPSHTLPTNGTGRFCSGLKIGDFLRRSSVVEYDARALRRARPVVAAFAALEGLDAHGASLEIRLRQP
jgi:histidinol dehydrogenase